MMEQLSFFEEKHNDPRPPLALNWNLWHGCTRASTGCLHCYVYRRDESIGKDPTVLHKTDNFNLPIRKQPKQSTRNLPCILFFHGGGFMLRASKAHYQIAKWYAQRANCKVVLPDYRLLPKYKYPVAIEDCYNTYLWLLKNAEKMNINKDMIIVAGDSGGGNIAGAVTAILRDRGFPLT